MKTDRLALPAIILILSLGAVPAVGGHGDPVAPPSFSEEQWGARELRYLDKKLSLVPGPPPAIPAPPAPGSGEEGDEIRQVISLQADDGNHARLDNMFEEISAPLGPLLVSRGVLPERRMAPTLWKLAELVHADISVATLDQARRFSRVAPHRLSDRIASRTGPASAPAYPALSHARMAAVLGLLGQITPECRDDYELMLSDAALNLAYSGMHRMSDMRAAETLARWYLGRLAGTRFLGEDMIRAQTEMSVFTTVSGCPVTGAP
ncbi:MAG: hypothetical protein CMO01_00830, partial [Thalassobius sp.]|nr:hypothetical protein [Thalassovita sp.]